jgi:hypothetical protein
MGLRSTGTAYPTSGSQLIPMLTYNSKLDEADVFLAKRTGSDMQRNSLVSGRHPPPLACYIEIGNDRTDLVLVFLRVLEYYSGILFLTTNRVGTFDPAFRSRIHISLYYPPLNGEQTLKVWKVNLKRTVANDKYRVEKAEIIAFAKERFRKNASDTRWNGRQIRNAFQTAIALAEYDLAEDIKEQQLRDQQDGLNIDRPELRGRRAVLRVEHFEKVARASKDFDEYLTSVHGRNESERAFHESTRKDDWEQASAVWMRPASTPNSQLKTTSNVNQRPSRVHPQDSGVLDNDFRTSSDINDLDQYDTGPASRIPNNNTGHPGQPNNLRASKRTSKTEYSETPTNRGRGSQSKSPNLQRWDGGNNQPSRRSRPANNIYERNVHEALDAEEEVLEDFGSDTEDEDDHTMDN